MSMKAVLQYRASPRFCSLLRSRSPAWLHVAIVDEDDRKAFADEMREASVLLHVLEPVTREVLEASKTLKLVQKIGVGVNTIDLDTAKRLGVGVANMPGTNTQAVAEHVLALTLALLRRIPELDRETRRGKGWHIEPSTIDAMGEIGGRTVGLVGYGAVAQRLVPLFEAFGARVIFATRRATGDSRQRTLDALFADADIVSLHLPLDATTRGIVGERQLARMKPNAVLVNTARGALIDESALVRALHEGRLGGAALDVFEAEPIDAAHPLRALALPNVVVTPHLAWLTPETLTRSLDVAFENCRRVRDREPLVHAVLEVTRS
jgi:phosphoglycerate dehydrogenase-like enzyme